MKKSNKKHKQIDTIAILGFGISGLNKTGECPGVITVPTHNFGGEASGNTRLVMCNGNGMCKPKGCQCRGNWDGADCGNCKFGFVGLNCDINVLVNVPAINFCSLAMFEDLMDFQGDALELRWSIQEYTFRTTRVMRPRHFGTKFTSPLISLGQHSHVHIQAGFFIMDMPNHDDSGVISRIAKVRSSNPSRRRTPDEQASEGERVIYIKRAPYITGENVIGTGKGDTSDQMDVTTAWESPQISVEFEIWSPDVQSAVGAGVHRLTLTYFTIDSCTYPSQSGSDSPDTEIN